MGNIVSSDGLSIFERLSLVNTCGDGSRGDGEEGANSPQPASSMMPQNEEVRHIPARGEVVRLMQELNELAKQIVTIFSTKFLGSPLVGIDSIGVANLLKVFIFLSDEGFVQFSESRDFSHLKELLFLVKRYRDALAGLRGCGMSEKKTASLIYELESRCKIALNNRRERQTRIDVGNSTVSKLKRVVWRYFFIFVIAILLVCLFAAIYFANKEPQKYRDIPYVMPTMEDVVKKKPELPPSAPLWFGK